jgi:hypothetical protein
MLDLEEGVQFDSFNSLQTDFCIILLQWWARRLLTDSNHQTQHSAPWYTRARAERSSADEGVPGVRPTELLLAAHASHLSTRRSFIDNTKNTSRYSPFHIQLIATLHLVTSQPEADSVFLASLGLLFLLKRGSFRNIVLCMSDESGNSSAPASDAIITCLNLFDSFSAMAYLDGSCRWLSICRMLLFKWHTFSIYSFYGRAADLRLQKVYNFDLPSFLLHPPALPSIAELQPGHDDEGKRALIHSYWPP